MKILFCMHCRLTILFLLCNSIVAKVTAVTFHPQSGDLLFQSLDCGKLCDGINLVTQGYGKAYVAHIGMVAGVTNSQLMVIEANGSGVVLTPLFVFLKRSHDSNGKPRVMVGRLKKQYQNLVPKALTYAKMQLGKPYNATFYPNHNESFYCSQLIYQSFLVANHGQSIFHTNKMNFINPNSSKLNPAWRTYFQALHIAPPQNMSGTNPGMMSTESAVSIIYHYGSLRSKKI